MSINWKLYEQDINRWYLDQEKTVKETIQLLKDTHHVVITYVATPANHVFLDADATYI